MNLSKISIRYAKALYQFAKEKNTLDEVKSDMILLEQTSKIVEFGIALDSPTAKASDKKLFVDKVFQGKVSEVSLSFIQMVLENKRDGYLESIARAFLDIYRAEQGVKKVILKTPKPVDSNQRLKVISFVESNFNAKADMVEIIDESLLGGFVLQVEDKQLDASVAYKLKKIKMAMYNAKA